jgi:hypothetical protein
MIFKKSQAALEFLTTYAWAFLVILIMIGALAYFGILSPNKLLPERCTFGSEFECRDFQLDATNGNIELKIVNNVGETISVSDIKGRSEVATFGCDFTTATTVAPGEAKDFTVPGCLTAEWTAAGFTVGQKGKVDVTITYNTIASGTSYPHEVKGEIFATVQ